MCHSCKGSIPKIEMSHSSEESIRDREMSHLSKTSIAETEVSLLSKKSIPVREKSHSSKEVYSLCLSLMKSTFGSEVICHSYKESMSEVYRNVSVKCVTHVRSLFSKESISAVEMCHSS